MNFNYVPSTKQEIQIIQILNKKKYDDFSQIHLNKSKSQLSKEEENIYQSIMYIRNTKKRKSRFSIVGIC